MGICAKEFRELVIRPTLAHLGVTNSLAPAAANLLLGTAAQESGLGFHLKINRGQGIGIYQVTPKTHRNIWDKYLIDHPNLASAVRGLASQHEFLLHPDAELTTNLSYATAIAWMVYRKADQPLPKADDIAALGHFWARHFNPRRHDDAALFCQSYKEFIAPGGDNIAA